jgi:hypothetical protein
VFLLDDVGGLLSLSSYPETVRLQVKPIEGALVGEGYVV